MINKIVFILGLVCYYGEAVAKCTYNGTSEIVTISLSPKIATDPTIPVGSILYTKKITTGPYKTFECKKIMSDQYIIESSTPVVAGVTGIQGKPVYETGIDGLGFQVSDILTSKNGSLTPAVAGSVLVPKEKSDNDYKFITLWLVKTKAVIDTAGTSSNPYIKFSAGNLNTNPRPSDRLLLTANVKFQSINFQDSSCDISVSGPKQITLNKIEKNVLLSVSRGAATPSQKTITMNIICPMNSIGNTLSYWFNPISGSSSSGNGIIENMLTGATAATMVGIIFKKDNNPIVFYDTDKYRIDSLKNSQSINFTADYYKLSDNASEITSGNVKAMMEVIIQEE